MATRSLLIQSSIELMLVMWAMPAAASPTFPPVIKDKLGLSAEPPCTICHATDQGGLNTAVKPFGATMRGFGLRAGDTAALRVALDQAEARRTDSDGDGTPDIVELERGEDPNDGAELPLPQTGCSIAPAELTRAAGRHALVLTTLAWIYARYRARRRIA